MPIGYQSWTGPARALAAGIDAALASVLTGDPGAFAEALSELRRGDPDIVAGLLGTKLLQLIERTYPDGLDSDDAATLIDDVARGVGWYPDLDRDNVAVALIAALGMHDPAETPNIDPTHVTEHGLLLIATLLASADDLPPLVDNALRELHRAQTVEMP